MLSLDLYIFLKNEVSRKISFVGTQAAQVQQETWPALRSNNKKENIRRAETRKNYVNIVPLFRNATNAAECAFRPLGAVCQRLRRGWGRGLVTAPRLREVTRGRSSQPGGRARQEHFLFLFSELEINLSVLRLKFILSTVVTIRKIFWIHCFYSIVTNWKMDGSVIRTRSGERWRCDPYADRQSYYSSSLVSTYLSPPPESRWRRTSSDSALYQKLNNPQSSNNQKSASEQSSPEYCGAALEDVKPSADLLQSLLREPQDQLQSVKKEPRLVTMGGSGALVSSPGRLPSPGPQYHAHSGSSSPVSPAPPPLYSPGQLPPHHQQQHFLPPQQNNLEEKFQKFRLDCQPQFQDSGGNYLTQNPGTPTTGVY